MEHMEHKSNPPSEGELDRILDAALAKYASAEPRTGLEDRILTGLHSSEITGSHGAWWHWSLAAALAALFITLAIGLSISSTQRETAQRKVIPTQAIPSQGGSPRLNHDDGDGSQTHVRTAVIQRPRQKTTVAKNPKLDVFPSPHPLSEQEQMLARYVSQFNDEALIVARVRTDAMRMDREKEMQEAEQSGNEYSKAR